MIRFKQYLFEVKRDAVRASKLLDYIDKRSNANNSDYFKGSVPIAKSASVADNWGRLEKLISQKHFKGKPLEKNPVDIYHSQFVDHFVNEKPVVDHPINKISIIQRRVESKGVKEKIVKNQNNHPVKLLHHNGEHFLIDGHHRYFKARLKGEKTIPARIIDL